MVHVIEKKLLCFHSNSASLLIPVCPNSNVRKLRNGKNCYLRPCIHLKRKSMPFLIILGFMLGHKRSGGCPDVKSKKKNLWRAYNFLSVLYLSGE